MPTRLRLKTPLEQPLDEPAQHHLVTQGEAQGQPLELCRPRRDWHRKELEVLRAWLDGLTGKGRVILVADSGAASSVAHRVRQFYWLERGRLARGLPFDTSADWHGTMMVEAIAQVAPEAEVNVASILRGKKGRHSDLLKALDLAAEPDLGLDVVNLSLGAYDLAQGEIAQLANALGALESRGVVVVSAAGNRPDEQCYPAALNTVLSAGAFGPDRSILAKSGPFPDLILPGGDIYTTMRPGGDPWSSGTSLSSALLTGLVALIRQACPKTSPRLIREALTQTASDAPQYHRRSGWGRPDLFMAIDYIRSVLRD